MKRNDLIGALALAALAAAPRGWAAAPAAAGSYVSFTPPDRIFTCDVPANWPPFEEESPRGTAVHFLGPEEARGAFRAAIHIHFIPKGHAAFIPVDAAIQAAKKRDKASQRSISATTPWHVGRNRAERFEVTETRRLPDGLLPSATVELHHYYVFVQAPDGYFVIKLSSTRESYLDYRDAFEHLLQTFLITGNP